MVINYRHYDIELSNATRSSRVTFDVQSLTDNQMYIALEVPISFTHSSSFKLQNKFNKNNNNKREKVQWRSRKKGIKQIELIDSLFALNLLCAFFLFDKYFCCLFLVLLHFKILQYKKKKKTFLLSLLLLLQIFVIVPFQPTCSLNSTNQNHFFRSFRFILNFF